ncbi:MAG: twin-arginine translocation signal domain-containing protein [Acidobacteria bacterium]|nr:twin-arginine translocation signal domain-containing protein [Acidobacteriota bacterium]
MAKTNRREFVRTVATATAATFAGNGLITAQERKGEGRVNRMRLVGND